ncbi:YycH family regulatory protein [Staphylococcus simulans]
MRHKETAKSVILTLLVLMSIVLTYLMWNFSPDLANLETQDNKKTNQNTIGKANSESMSSVISPYQVVYSNDDKVAGALETRTINRSIVKVLQDKEVEDANEVYHAHNLFIPELSDNFLVLDFAYDMPLSMYLGQVLNMDSKVSNKYEFNRLLIDADQKDKAVIYAISSDHHRVMRMTTSIPSRDIKDLVKKIKPNLMPFTDIITNRNTIDVATHIYAPEKPQHLKTYRTIFNHISVETMNSILFSDSVVVRSTKSGNTTYNNNTGVATYNSENERYRYTNLSEDESKSKNMLETIPSTFDFINAHGGFTDDFRLFGTDDDSGELTYQMFLNGVPVFNENDLSTIKVAWGEKGIFSYGRALLKSNITIDSGEEKKKLPGAETVRSNLANNPSIDFKKVTNMTIGYTMKDRVEDDMEVQRNSEYVPQWYVQYDGEWYAYENGGLKS